MSSHGGSLSNDGGVRSSRGGLPWWSAVVGILWGFSSLTHAAEGSTMPWEWAEDWESAFASRSRHVIEQTAKPGGYGTTYFESEKRAYGKAMLAILGGYEAEGVAFLEQEDNQADSWHRETLGIDFYAAFTLKNQVRKYFRFGDYLDPAYRERMRKAAGIFTARDPLNRPHPAFVPGTQGWGPDARNSWVDIRSTDNLKLMRETAVYLFAEETGNTQTAALYRERLVDYIAGLYHYGMAEWDSENYLGHGIGPLLNLHDFAKDPAMRELASAGLCFLTASGAVKYWRGAYNGPTKRDYNHPFPFGGSAAAMLWMWFGDAPDLPSTFEYDEVHPITSPWRPPPAIVHLARKEFPKPAELIAGKPQVGAWERPEATVPTYRETQFIADHAQFGTLVGGTQAPDVNGFKILVYSSARGADTIVCAPCSDPLRIGSPMYQDGLLAGPSAVGQNRNCAVYLTRESSHPYLWTVPADATIESRDGVTFVACERSTIAIWPINLRMAGIDPELTRRVRLEDSKDGGTPKPRWPHLSILRGERIDPGLYGFAIELAGTPDAASREAFIEAAAEIGPDVGRLDEGEAEIAAVSGAAVRVRWADSPSDIRIWRNGVPRRWESPDENVVFGAAPDSEASDPALVSLPWQGDGTLTVRAGGRVFTCSVTRDGSVAMRHE